ncbi:MAG: LON peptidase substrate-binding domain-containing protein [Alphaproteobacteria bacterium]|nr:LON peptidase substrate-binding domain-containing protein [Alphaproteobacteria bacterium]
MNIPIFPLNGAILFPNTNLPLNIFEDRYIDMVDYALSHSRLIGMIQTKKNKDLFTIGCLGKITNFTETSDGRYQINLEGINRFKVKKILDNKHKFIMIDGEKLDYNSNFKKQTSELSTKLLSNFKNYLDIKKIEFNTSEFESLDTHNLAKIICVISPLDYLTKQMLLEFGSSDELCENLISVLEIEINNFGKSSTIN